MAAASANSKAKATTVPSPSIVPPNRSNNSGTSVQVLIKASPSIASAEEESTIKVTPKKDGKEKSSGGSGGTIKLKKPVPKHNLPGNWREGSVVDGDKKKGTDTPSSNNSVPTSPGPVVNQLDDNARQAFATGRPLEDGVDFRVCKHCKKSILKTAIKAHLIACLKAKKDKAQRKKELKEAREKERRALENDDKDGEGDDAGEDEDGEKGSGLKGAKKVAGKKVEIEKGKKRKAEGDAEKGPKQKKKKEEVKVKTTKQKGPVDVERQCGVLKDGVPCARSLTCKSHSMGAKRAVWRSLPYDMLLAAYQKKNQAKQQKAAIDANAPLEDEEAGNGPVDSDDEVIAVMNGLQSWNPQPAVPNIIHDTVQRQYKKQRIYDLMADATNGFTRDIFKVVTGGGYGSQRLPPGHPGHPDNLARAEAAAAGDGDAEGEPETPGGGGLGMGMANVAAKRASSFTMALPQRRPSTVIPR